MKKLLIIAITLLGLTGCSGKDLRQVYEYVDETAAEVPLTEAEVTAALRDALARGISRGAAQASAENGYYGDPRLRIPFPPEVKKVEQAFREVGLGAEVERFVRQLNRAAELAALRAKPIFINAITSMSIDDAFDILEGEADAATRYLERTTGDELRAAFGPIIGEALDETSATRYYDDLIRAYNKMPFTRRVDPDLARYATERSIEGLFLLIADEEASLRADPSARTTRLLRRVFGSLDS
jgi:hypothetical protein